MTCPPPEFSNLQWYLAHARNCVHFSTYLDRKISATEFDAIVDLVLSRAPQMLWRENLEDDCHELTKEWRREDCIQFTRKENLHASYSQILLENTSIIHQNTGPAFHATCHTADKSGPGEGKSLICISASHATIEGLDLSTLTRSAQPRKSNAESEYNSAPTLQRIGAMIIGPILGIFHLISANLQKKRPDEFGFASLSVDKASMRRMAKSMGVSQRSLYFSVVLFYLHADRKKAKKRSMIAYSSLKDNHITQEQDAFLRLKMHVLFVKQDVDFTRFAQAIDLALKKQDAGGNFNQHMYNKVLAFHRLIYPFLRPLYSRNFFNYIPYDMVLSLLPPVKPMGELSFLNEAPIFGSSFTKGGENCIIVAGNKFLTFNFWARTETLEAVDNLKTALAEMKVEGEITR